MKPKPLIAAAQIALAVFLLSQAVYAVLTLPILTVDKEIWVISIAFAFAGSAMLGFLPFLAWTFQLCQRAAEYPFSYFYRQIRSKALLCATGSAILVTLFFTGMLGIGHLDKEVVLMTAAGAIAPLPVVVLLKSAIRSVYHGFNPAI